MNGFKFKGNGFIVIHNVTLLLSGQLFATHMGTLGTSHFALSGNLLPQQQRSFAVATCHPTSQ